MMSRLLSIALLSALLSCVPVHPVSAQTFPSKTVNLVVPYPAGGVTDMLSRALAIELAKLWGQPVVVENVPGAGSIIGAEKVANAPPDGHTLLITIDPTVISNRFLYKKLPYDPDKSLIPITMLARSGQLVIANPSFPASNMRELVEAARGMPEKVAYASYGIGTQPHLLFETIGKREGVQLLHVPYKGVMPDVTATVAGEVQLTLAAPAVAGQMVKAGKVKALAIGGLQRSSLFPDVPTIAESGYTYVDAVLWWGVFAPKGASAQLVERLNRDFTSIARRPDFAQKYIAAQGLDLVAGSPSEFAAQISADVKVTGEMVKAAGVKPE